MTNGLCSTCLFPLSMFQVCVLLVSIPDGAIIHTYQCHCHPCRDFSTWAVVLSFCMWFLVLTDNPSCCRIFKGFCTKFSFVITCIFTYSTVPRSTSCGSISEFKACEIKEINWWVSVFLCFPVLLFDDWKFRMEKLKRSCFLRSTCCKRRHLLRWQGLLNI